MVGETDSQELSPEAQKFHRGKEIGRALIKAAVDQGLLDPNLATELVNQASDRDLEQGLLDGLSDAAMEYRREQKK